MDALAGPAAPTDLHVMSFNVRYATGRTPNSWAQRRPAMRDLLTAERPDLIGTQEGLAPQLRDIEADLGAPGGERADWILTTPGVTTLAALMNTYRRGAQYPSDHLPVQARLLLP
jgi:endonuclease/exonuclease/phosphatase family metal-dependent hydrolase